MPTRRGHRLAHATQDADRDAQENNVLVAGAGLLAGVFVGLMMLLLT